VVPSLDPKGRPGLAPPPHGLVFLYR